jgi:hypothetical protein
MAPQVRVQLARRKAPAHLVQPPQDQRRLPHPADSRDHRQRHRAQLPVTREQSVQDGQLTGPVSEMRGHGQELARQRHRGSASAHVHAPIDRPRLNGRALCRAAQNIALPGSSKISCSAFTARAHISHNPARRWHYQARWHTQERPSNHGLVKRHKGLGHVHGATA